MRAPAVAAGVVVCVAACTNAPARPSVAATPSTCGVVHIDEVLSPPPDRPRAVEALQLGGGAVVDNTVAVRATVPFASKVGLPDTPRVLWLIYTTESGAPAHTGHPGPAVQPGASPGPQHLLHLVDDATMQPAGTYPCQH